MCTFTKPRCCSCVLLALTCVVASSLICVSNTSAQEQFYRARWALLIGVGQFQSTDIPALQFCENDVNAVRQLLVGKFGFPPDHIVTLLNTQATKASIVQELSRLADSRRISSEDAVLVYYSGHGQTVDLPRGGKMGYLIPCDADVDLRDPNNTGPYEETCLGMDELRLKSAAIPAKHILFLVDACYSGLAIEGRRAVRMLKSIETFAKLPVRQIITAGLKGEQAMEDPKLKHGAFTYSLIGGLDTGAADMNRDSVVTGMELATYLRDAVPRLSPQTPLYDVFDGEGEFLFDYGAKPAPTNIEDTAPRIQLTDPQDIAGGTEEIDVKPVGDTVSLKGVVLDSQPIAGITVDGRTISFSPTQAADLYALLRPTDRVVVQFQTSVKVEQGETRSVVLRARDAAGKDSSRRLVFRSVADDTQPPEVRVTEVRTRDGAGQEVAWRGITAPSIRGITAGSRGIPAASRGITAMSKAVIVVPREGESLWVGGFVRDDRSVVSVSVNGQPAHTEHATRSQLDGLGWTSGLVFEGLVSGDRDSIREVEVAAADAAGNEGRVTVSLEGEQKGGPEILILEPTQTRDLRGTGLLLPKGAETMRVTGLAGGSVRVAKVTVGGRDATIRPATAADLGQTGWQSPTTYFTATVPIPDSGTTETLVVEAVDERGGRATRSVLAQRESGAPLQVRFTGDKPSYHLGEWLHFQITANRDCYAYIFHKEPNGSLSLFLPNPVEPDPMLIAGTMRTFPNPFEEKRWQGQYGLVVQEPTGTDIACCLVVPCALSPLLLQNLSTLGDLGNALEVAGRQRGTKLNLPMQITDRDIAALAEQLGGAWQIVKYEVKR